MFIELIYSLLWKALEIVFVVVLGFCIFVLLKPEIHEFWAIASIIVLFYFFTPKIKPYIDCARKFIYKSITGKDNENY